MSGPGSPSRVDRRDPVVADRHGQAQGQARRHERPDHVLQRRARLVEQALHQGGGDLVGRHEHGLGHQDPRGRVEVVDGRRRVAVLEPVVGDDQRVRRGGDAERVALLDDREAEPDVAGLPLAAPVPAAVDPVRPEQVDLDLAAARGAAAALVRDDLLQRVPAGARVGGQELAGHVGAHGVRRHRLQEARSRPPGPTGPPGVAGPVAPRRPRAGCVPGRRPTRPDRCPGRRRRRWWPGSVISRAATRRRARLMPPPRGRPSGRAGAGSGAAASPPAAAGSAGTGIPRRAGPTPAASRRGGGCPRGRWTGRGRCRRWSARGRGRPARTG